MDKLKEVLTKSNIDYKLNENLLNKSTFKVGSTCSLFTSPSTFEDFQKVIKCVKEEKLPFFVLGGGSNIVFPDHNYDGVVISTENLKDIDIVPSLGEKKSATVLVRCSAGSSMASFVNFCTQNGLSGAEQFAGLPGSVGGAVYMNARCFNKSINELFTAAFYIDEETSDIKILDYQSSDWAYKKSPFQPKEGSGVIKEHKIVLNVIFKLTKIEDDNIKDIEKECKKYINERASKGHFKFPSAGSVFKNNHDFGKPSGMLIDEAGLRGLQIGGAQIAPFHGNFIINVDNAKASDIKSLVEKVISTVKERFGFTLEPEIIFL